MNATIITDELWMARCFDLARLGIGYVSPNPPVGAVLVYQNKILAEGYHHGFGAPHAEVDAVNNVSSENRHLIPASTLYVSLEPCCTFGKTPPCTELILNEGIKDVRICAVDPNPLVSGRSISILESQGVKITSGILAVEGNHLIRAFNTYIKLHRPFVVLKWAQSKYAISGVHGQQIWFSHPDTQSFSHRLRATYDCILVGARTVENDNPLLTSRDYPGRSPARVIFDPHGRLDGHYNVFNDDGVKVFYFSQVPNSKIKQVETFLLSPEAGPAAQILTALYERNIGSLLVEGGAYVHQVFVRENLWDEAWVIQTQNEIAQGITAPNIRGKLIEKLASGMDTIVGIANG